MAAFTPRPGDLVFCDGQSLVGRAIKIAEWFRWRKGDWFSHVGIVEEQIDDTDDFFVLQAVSQGVNRTRLSKMANTTIVPLPWNCDPLKVIAFAKKQVGEEYGVLTIISIVFSILTPRFFTFRARDTWICSALAAESLRYGGWLTDWPDIYQVSPAELWAALPSSAIAAAFQEDLQD